MFVANQIQLGDTPMRIASTLVGKTVRYMNQTPSSVPKTDGIRTFKIEAVDDVFVSKKGTKCATVQVKDVDDGGETKFRTLHLAGISHVV